MMISQQIEMRYGTKLSDYPVNLTQFQHKSIEFLKPSTLLSCTAISTMSLKIVGIPQVSETESPEDTVSICLKLFSCIGADITIQDIDIAQRVPAKSTQTDRPNPIICKFVRRLAKEKVMTARRSANNIVAADLDLINVSINHIGIYDHLTPRLQVLLLLLHDSVLDDRD